MMKTEITREHSRFLPMNDLSLRREEAAERLECYLDPSSVQFRVVFSAVMS
jgi:hypothetical protein